MTLKAQDYLKQFDKLVSDRQTTETLWNEIAKFNRPGSEFLTQHHPGQKRRHRMFDSTGEFAIDRLASLLYSMLTSTHVRWFTLRPQDSRLNLSQASLEWLDLVSDLIFQSLTAKGTGYSTATHEFYLELATFGNAVLFEDMKYPSVSSPRFGLRFRSYPIKDCYFIENEDGHVDTLYRRIHKMSHYKALRMFGADKLPAKIIKKLDENPFDEEEYLHVVHPSDAPQVYDAPVTDRPFTSVYIHKDTRTIIDSGGFDEFPYMVARFMRRSGEKEGFGPGGKSLPEVKRLNRLSELSLRGIAKLVDPPLLVPDNGVVGPLNTNPSGIIKYDSTLTGQISPLDSKSRPDLAEGYSDSLRSRVSEHHHISNTALPVDRPEMTAFEVDARRNEGFQGLDPTLGRLTAELLEPLIDRSFGLLLRHDLLPAPTEELQNVELVPEYLSPIAQAQRQVEADSILRSVQMAATLASADPLVMTNFNGDEIVRHTALNINRVPHKLMTSPEEVSAARNQAAEQASAQAAQEQAAAQGQAFKDTAQGVKNIGSII